jgi:hypothetical protein
MHSDCDPPAYGLNSPSHEKQQWVTLRYLRPFSQQAEGTRTNQDTITERISLSRLLGDCSLSK